MHLTAKWDINRILAVGGGADNLIERHGQKGFAPLSHSAIASWRFRQSVPATRLAEVCLTLHAIDPNIDLFALIRTIPKQR